MSTIIVWICAITGTILYSNELKSMTIIEFMRKPGKLWVLAVFCLFVEYLKLLES